MLDVEPQSEKIFSDNGGYKITDPYTSRYFQRQSPQRLLLTACLNDTKEWHKEERFKYCELGCGNGITACVLAAAFPQASFTAIDFNTEHIENATQLAIQAGLNNIEFIHSDFQSILNTNFSTYDYVTVHGVLSWVNEDVQKQVFDVIDKLLNSDGIAFISYNSFPGWAATLPFSQMMLKEVDGMEGSAAEKATAALNSMTYLRDAGAAYFDENESAAKHLDHLLAEDPVYIAHEFLNDSFNPKYVKDVIEAASQRNLYYIGSANIIKNNINYTIPPQLRDYIFNAPDVVTSEHRKSIVRNEDFRDDVFHRPALTHQSSSENKLHNIIVGAITPTASLPNELSINGIALSYASALYEKLMPLMATGQHTVHDLICHPELCSFSPDLITNFILDCILTEYFDVFLTSTHAEISAEVPWRLSHDLSAILLERKVLTEGTAPVVSDIIGGALHLPPMVSLTLWAINKWGRTLASSEIHTLLNSQKNYFVSTSVTLEWIEANLDYFDTEWVPVLSRLGIIELL